jgi:hypothetical protein
MQINFDKLSKKLLSELKQEIEKSLLRQMEFVKLQILLI